MIDDFEARMEARDLIEKCLSRLSPKEEDILIGRAVYREHFHTIAARYGISTERVRQIDWKAMRRMRRHLLVKHKIRVPNFSDQYLGKLEPQPQSPPRRPAPHVYEAWRAWADQRMPRSAWLDHPSDPLDPPLTPLALGRVYLMFLWHGLT